MLKILIVAGSMFVPVLLALGLVLGYRKWQDRDGRRSPIENKTIYGAGEQLRKRADEHWDEMLFGVSALFFLGPYFLAAWALLKLDLGNIAVGWLEVTFAVAFVALTALTIIKVFRHGKRRRMAIAGLRAELYTAQELNRLMALGCTVLHDIPGEGFNIDHVVIAPRAVYSVETKSVRKPRSTGSSDHFKVSYDGECLRFPDFSDSKRLQQTRRQADWLANYLRQATGRAVPVIPALALPGWWIDTSSRAGSSEVKVFNPAGRGAHFMAADSGVPVSDPAIRSLVAQALVMRFPTEADVAKTK